MRGLSLLALALCAFATTALVGAGTAGSTTPFTLKYAISPGNAANLTAIDPAKSLTQIAWQAEYMTCANLFNRPDVDLSNGGRAVPEVSDGAPAVTPDGLTYTFTLKTSYTFSDGTPVTPSAYATEINRVKTLTDPSFAAYAADIANVSADDAASKLTITLSAPDADLPDRLAMPIFCPVPQGTGANPPLPLPASGPYMIGPTSSGSALTLVSNPRYTGSRPHNPSSIEFISVSDPSTLPAAIDAGTYDLADNIGNTGYANAVAALESGATLFDASCGGLGGCPYAPRATGNIATEDLVYLFDGEGVETGVDLDALIATSQWLERALGRRLEGQVYRAGAWAGD